MLEAQQPNTLNSFQMCTAFGGFSENPVPAAVHINRFEINSYSSISNFIGS